MLALLALSAAAPNLHVAAYKDDVNVIKDQLRLGVDVNLKSEEGDRGVRHGEICEATNEEAPSQRSSSPEKMNCVASREGEITPCDA